MQVSIQLIAPASGANGRSRGILRTQCRIVSIQLIAPASGASTNRSDRGSAPSRVSIQLIAPASGAEAEVQDVLSLLNEVSIQLIAPASGAFFKYRESTCGKRVSIQLIAPASGAHLLLLVTSQLSYKQRPQQVGPTELDGDTLVRLNLVSIQLIAPASGALVMDGLMRRGFIACFHSTDCPSKWGLLADTQNIHLDDDLEFPFN